MNCKSLVARILKDLTFFSKSNIYGIQATHTLFAAHLKTDLLVCYALCVIYSPKKNIYIVDNCATVILLHYSTNSGRYDKSAKILLYYWNISARPKYSYLTIAWATPYMTHIAFMSSFRLYQTIDISHK